MIRGALSAVATLRVEQGPGRQRMRWSHAWPVLLRATGDDRVHLVHGAGGPLGGDVLALEVDLAPGASLRLCSAGATVVQPGAGERARWGATVRVGGGARLDWAPEPTVVCDGAELVSRLRVELASDGATAVVREVVVLGRHEERGGRYRGELSIDVGGVPLLAHTTLLDGADSALSGPGGTADAMAIGTVVLAGGAQGSVRECAATADPGPAGRPPEPGPPDPPVLLADERHSRRTGTDERDLPPCGGEVITGSGDPPGAGAIFAGYLDLLPCAAAGESPGVRWAWSSLEGPGRVLLAVGDPGAVVALLGADRQ